MSTENPNTQLANKTPVTILGEWLSRDAQKNALSQAMPKSMSIDPFMRCMFTALQRTPKLAECSRDSVWDAAIRSAQTGLLPDGYHAHLLPFKGKATFIADWKGLVQLAYNAGIIMQAEIVCENDDFSYNRGKIDRHIRSDIHPDKSKRQERGEMYAVYAICTLADGRERAELMSLPEIERIRKASPNGNSEFSPWQNHFSEMSKKTVVKRLCKWLPRSTELQKAIEADDGNERVIDIGAPASPALTDGEGQQEQAATERPSLPAPTARRGRPPGSGKGLAAASGAGEPEAPEKEAAVTVVTAEPVGKRGPRPAPVAATPEPEAPKAAEVEVLGTSTIGDDGEETPVTEPRTEVVVNEWLRGKIKILSAKPTKLKEPFLGQKEILFLEIDGVFKGTAYSTLLDNTLMAAGKEGRAIIKAVGDEEGAYATVTRLDPLLTTND